MLNFVKYSLAAFCALFACVSNATLIDRGGGLIYDDALNITWMQEVRYGMIAYEREVMDWNAANAFAQSVSYEDTVRGQVLTGWRLPSTVNAPSSWGWDTTGQSSELAYMFYVNLGYSPDMTFDRNVPEPTSSNYNPFTNLAYRGYWSSLYDDQSNQAWAFHFHFGFQNYVGTTSDQMMWWLVRDGDVADVTSVPEPTSLALMAIGLLGVGLSRRGKVRV